MKPFNNLYIPFSSNHLFFLALFHSSESIFNRFIQFIGVIILHEFLNICMRLLLIRVWCLTCWERPINVTLVDISDITSICYLQGYFMSSVFDVLSVGRYPIMFCIRQYGVCICLVRNRTLFPPFVTTS